MPVLLPGSNSWHSSYQFHSAAAIPFFFLLPARLPLQHRLQELPGLRPPGFRPRSPSFGGQVGPTSRRLHHILRRADGLVQAGRVASPSREGIDEIRRTHAAFTRQRPKSRSHRFRDFELQLVYVDEGQLVFVVDAASGTALAGRSSDGVADNLWQLADEAIDCRFDAAHILSHVVHLALNAAEACLDRSEIVAVAAGLFENMAGDDLLALDLAFDNADAGLELFAGYVGHSQISHKSTRVYSMGCSALSRRLVLDSGLARKRAPRNDGGYFAACTRFRGFSFRSIRLRADALRRTRHRPYSAA